ncbi:Serine/threonine protein phosphatase [Handroanthus impetiginosus]|uniref:protein-serine/threonine phosphatase n=1 Tax=Handroanthus impetiginosus TaxID=429701 RepID=A0A2G9HY87_9LAMI|nr:Serine/threonine protein phosphatase [Handroanthus impetiginosus]
MEEQSPAVAGTFSLGNPVCGYSGIPNPIEITRLKLETETAGFLSDPVMMLDDYSINRDNTEINEVSSSSKVELDTLETGQITDNGHLVHDVQEGEEDEILFVAEDPCLISSVELLPLDSTSDLSVPLDATSETSLPIAVEIEGIENGQILAKVISLEERSIKWRLSDDILTVAAAKQEEECSTGPTIKASVVAVKLSSEKESGRGGVRSVFELDCLPLWGSVSICGHRSEMEDAVMAVPHFMKIPIKMFIGDRGIDGISQTLSHLTSHFFGVYDGHGGSQVANYCRDRVHLALEEEIKNVKEPLVNGSTKDVRQVQWENVFMSCFLKVDDEIGGNASRVVQERNYERSNYMPKPAAPETVGSTAVVAVVCSSHIIVANCGDSRAVLYRGKEAIPLSVDHKPNREDEYARIEASGGKVIPWNGHRVFGVLAMSRSIGDRYFKPWIIPDPEVMFVPRAREDECLVLASDGLWDVLSNDEVCEVARKRILIWHKKNGPNALVDRGNGVDPAAQAAAEHLSNLALQKGSKDNISVIVVDLKAQRKFKNKS